MCFPKHSDPSLVQFLKGYKSKGELGRETVRHEGRETSVNPQDMEVDAGQPPVTVATAAAAGNSEAKGTMGGDPAHFIANSVKVTGINLGNIFA